MIKKPKIYYHNSNDITHKKTFFVKHSAVHSNLNSIAMFLVLSSPTNHFFLFLSLNHHKFLNNKVAVDLGIG